MKNREGGGERKGYSRSREVGKADVVVIEDRGEGLDLSGGSRGGEEIGSGYICEEEK